MAMKKKKLYLEQRVDNVAPVRESCGMSARAGRAHQVDGSESLLMNNTLMTSLPIPVELTLCAEDNVEREGGLWGKRGQSEGGRKV